MEPPQVAQIITQVRTLVEAHYVFPDVALQISAVLAARAADGAYPADEVPLAAAVTADLQSVNADKHLRLVYRPESSRPRPRGDDADEYAAMTRWADRTCGGIACAQHLAGNIGYLDLKPVLFPAAIAGEAMTAAMSLLARTEALLIDVRGCLGGEPAMVSFLISYLWDREPVQLSGLRERAQRQIRQAWTLPWVPGRRYGASKPVYVLTSGTTFSGAEQLSYDLQQLGRATIVGERTGGGAHAREGFPVGEHLEATIPVAAAVSPLSGGNWEGTGVLPDVPTTASDACETAYRLALEHLKDAGGPAAAEARELLHARVRETQRQAGRPMADCCPDPPGPVLSDG